MSVSGERPDIDGDWTNKYGRVGSLLLKKMISSSGLDVHRLLSAAPDRLPDIGDPLLYHVVASTSFELLRRNGLEVYGAPSVINDGVKRIIAVSHHSKGRPYLDLVAPSSYMYNKYGAPIHGMAKHEAFKYRALGRPLLALGAFPVNRENPENSSIVTAIGLINRNLLPGIAPEGGTIRRLEVPKLKRGVGLISSIAEAKILPVITLPEPVAKQKRYKGKIFPKVVMVFSDELNRPWDERGNYSVEELVKMLKQNERLPKSLLAHSRKIGVDLQDVLQTGINEAIQKF